MHISPRGTLRNALKYLYVPWGILCIYMQTRIVDNGIPPETAQKHVYFQWCTLHWINSCKRMSITPSDLSSSYKQAGEGPERSKDSTMIASSAPTTRRVRMIARAAKANVGPRTATQSNQIERIKKFGEEHEKAYDASKHSEPLPMRARVRSCSLLEE